MFLSSLSFLGAPFVLFIMITTPLTLQLKQEHTPIPQGDLVLVYYTENF